MLDITYKSSKVGVKGLLSWALEKATSTQMTTMCVPTSNCLVGKLQMQHDYTIHIFTSWVMELHATTFLQLTTA